MNEDETLRRFAVRRRARRGVVKAAARRGDDGVVFSSRVFLQSSVFERVMRAAARFDVSRTYLIGATLRWFANQPELIQAVILRRRMPSR